MIAAVDCFMTASVNDRAMIEISAGFFGLIRLMKIKNLECQ